MILPISIAAAVFLVLIVARAVLLKIGGRLAENTARITYKSLLASIRVPSIYWCAAVGIYAGINISGYPERYVKPLSTAIYVLLILSVTIAVADMSVTVFNSYLQKSTLPIVTTGLAHGVLKGVILAAGFLLILSVLGVSIAPLLTALGVGGLAVALALQETLANLFAGIHILMEKMIRIGDVLKLENGQEGCVLDISWRTTRIRTPSNTMVVIPNSKLAQSIVTNFDLPDKPVALQLPISVSYESSPERVEKIVTEEVQNLIGKVSGLLGEPAPFVTLVPGFGVSSLDFTLTCQVREYGDQNRVQDALRKAVLRRLTEEGIKRKS